MAITSLDQLIAAPVQLVTIQKTSSVTAIAVNYTQVIQANGNPGAGVLAGTNSANGLVPTSSTPGFPILSAFGLGASGYLSQVTFGSTVACRLVLVDCVFKAGTYPFNANVTLTAQPSYAGRMPAAGTNFTNTEIWIEAATSHSGNQTINIGYTNQDGVSGRSTGAIATGVAPILGRMLKLPLQAGDSGVQQIDSVVSTVSTNGTFNVLVVRRLWTGRVLTINYGDTHDFLKTGMPEVWADSAVMVLVSPDLTATGLFELQAQVVNG
jgi:hypothetical protein